MTKMKKVKLLDNTDELLLKTLSRYPRINQLALAKKIGITQPAISLRLRKLKDMGLINDHGSQLDPDSLGLKMIKVDLKVNNGNKLMRKFSNCPVVANSYLTENNSMSIIFVGENIPFLNCLVNQHIKNNPEVTNVTTQHIIFSLHGCKTSMDADQELDTPPCGDQSCDKCEYYVDNGGECVGCPVTKFYKGTFWK